MSSLAAVLNLDGSARPLTAPPVYRDHRAAAGTLKAKMPNRHHMKKVGLGNAGVSQKKTTMAALCPLLWDLTFLSPHKTALGGKREHFSAESLQRAINRGRGLTRGQACAVTMSRCLSGTCGWAWGGARISYFASNVCFSGLKNAGMYYVK